MQNLHLPCEQQHLLPKRADDSSYKGRRTFITNLSRKGVGIRVLQALAGHRNIQTTARYIEVDDAMKRAAVELV